MTGSSSTAADAPTKKAGGASGKRVNLPPVITVEGKGDEGGSSVDGDKGFGQARTPKHANKMREDDAGHGDHQSKITPDRGLDPKHDDGRQHYSGTTPYPGNFPVPRPYEGRPLGGGGAFQPHESRRQPPPPPGDYYARSPPMHTVSPGGGHHRYYPSSHGRPPRMDAGYPPHPQHPPPPSNYYDQRRYGEYGARSSYEGHPPPGFRGHYPPGPPSAGPPPGYSHQSYGSYPSDGRGYPPHPSGPPQPYHGGQSAYPHPSEHYQRSDPRYPTDHHGNPSGTFSRAVSSSFDRSVKSRGSDDKPPASLTPTKTRKPLSPAAPPADASMASDDSSWKLLKQVHSVDDSAIRERLKKDKEEAEDHIQVQRQPGSTSSSLTNSPTEGPERLHAAKEAQRVVAAAAAAAAAATVGQQQPSSLDSLSSVASAQVPMATDKAKDSPAATRGNLPPPSPAGTDTGSLDLMKCSSGSSGLLHLPSHQRTSSMEGLLYEGKRGRDEERGDVNTSEPIGNKDELRRAPSDYDDSKAVGDQPPTKRVRLLDGKTDIGDKYKASPLSITCSPSAEKTKESGRLSKSRQGKTDYTSPQPMEGSFYDKPPAYSYSIDSAPSIPRDAEHRKQASYPSLPPRPGSSTSSTITPNAMHVEDQHQASAAVPSVPSWEIHAQDSFGNGSIGGGQGLTSSFSFQDYPILPANESETGSSGNPSGHGGPPPTMHPHHAHPPHHSGAHPPIESRNQSFEGGHYHGGPAFHRTDSMDVSYGGGRSGHMGGYPPQHGHQGQFPPHAPSWGTERSEGSHPSAYHGHPPSQYGHYGGRMGHDYHHGGVMRNYSQDSGHRASPPPGPHHMPHASRGPPPPGFQPPSEFVAPHNPHLTRRPPPAVYIMPTSQGGGHAQRRGNGVFSWTKDDDIRLTEIMKKYKNPRDWEPIAKEHGCGKSAKECHERWIRYLKPGVRKGQWTDQEDAIVIEAVTTSTEQPFTRWSDLAQRLPGRVGKQIRDRWVNHLNPNINHLPFSREEDLLLWDGHKKLGKRWVEISTKFFNSVRSENHIKNRWYSASFKKFIANEFGPEAYAGTKTTKEKDDKKKKTSASNKDEDPTVEAI